MSPWDFIRPSVRRHGVPGSVRPASRPAQGTGTTAWCAAALGLAALLIGQPLRSGEPQWQQVPLGEGALKDEPVSTGKILTELVVFDGRLYLELGPEKVESEPAQRQKLTAEIVSYDPKTDKLQAECAVAGTRLGRIRRAGHWLVVPEAVSKEKAAAGYWVSRGGGKWERVAVTGLVGIEDVAVLDGKWFLAGSEKKGAAIAWREANGKEWKMEALTEQAARFSAEATRFITCGGYLFVLAKRLVPKEVKNLPPQAWGPIYLLRYHPQGSERGFIFDGPPRPVRALQLMAPGGALLDAHTTVSHEEICGDGIVYAIRPPLGRAVEESKNGLVRARVEKALAWEGETLVGRRIPGLANVWNVITNGGLYYALSSEGIGGQTQILASRDAEKWEPVFKGLLPKQGVALAMLDGALYVGLWDGRIGRIEK